MWFNRLRMAVQPNRESAVALAGIAMALLLVLGGVAVAKQFEQPEHLATLSTTTTVPAFAGVPAPPESTISIDPVVPPETTVPQLPTIDGEPSVSVPRPPVAPPAVGQPAPTAAPRTPPTSAVPVTPTTAPATNRSPILITNGPERPTVVVNQNYGRYMPEDPQISIVGQASDGDGYIRRIEINWDDSSAPTVLDYSMAACAIPSRPIGIEQAHTYESPGTYNVTVTVTSVSCTGADQQHAIGSVQVSAAGPPSENPLTF